MYKLLQRTASIAVPKLRMMSHYAPFQRGTLTVDELKIRTMKCVSTGYTTRAAEIIYEASKLALVRYVEKLEYVSSSTVIPKEVDRYNTEMLYMLVSVLSRKLSEGLGLKTLGLKMRFGWGCAYAFNREYSEYDIDFYEFSRELPDILRMINIVENELPVNKEMAEYIKYELFDIHKTLPPLGPQVVVTV